MAHIERPEQFRAGFFGDRVGGVVAEWLGLDVGGVVFRGGRGGSEEAEEGKRQNGAGRSEAVAAGRWRLVHGSVPSGLLGSNVA